MSLLEKLQHSVDNMSMGEKFLAGLQVTFIGISIVFLALFLLYVIITLMTKILVSDKKPVEKKPVTAPMVQEEVVEEDGIDEWELVAVISAAIAASLHTSTHNIIVRNIVRVGDETPVWGRVGRIK